ncbi:hypothetical protein B0H19DRAFT_894518, partial [Mycena capillaripes]
PGFLDAQRDDIVNILVTSGPMIDNVNSVANDATIGVANPSYAIDEHHNRSSVHDHLVDVKKSTGGKLQFALDTLATKVLLCEKETGGSPVAYGVEIAVGAALAFASNFKGKQLLKTEVITVRHEVIISAGVFQSPHLVCIFFFLRWNQPTRLETHSLFNFPSNKRDPDHDEVANIWTLKKNHTLLDGCTVLYTPKEGPCLKFWMDSGHQNLYSFGALLSMIMLKSAPVLPKLDVMIYWIPAYFRGCFHGL